MGHLETDPGYSSIPSNIREFVYTKAKMYLTYATDKKGLGCMFYILKPGVQKNWNYYYGNDIVNITFDVDTFNPNNMKMLS